MEDRVSRLIALLSEKEGALQELLQLLEEEQNCLLKHDVDLLQSQAEKKVDLYARLTNSARLSRQLIDQVAVEVGVPGANNLSLLLPKLSESQRETLQGQQRRLLDLGSALEKLSTRNGDLIQGSLLTVSRSLEFFGRMFNRSSTYSEAGRMVGGAPRPRLLRREI